MANLQTKMYFPGGGLNSDTNSLYVKDTEFVGVNNLRVKPNSLSTRNGCKLYGGSNPTGSSVLDGNPILHFHAYKVPNGPEIYFAFTKNNVYKYTHASTAWLTCLDPAITTAIGVNYITKWDTTDFIDSTLGPIVVAAGSIPGSDIAAESDADNRILIYWNTVATPAARFDTLTISENLDVVDEDLGFNAAATISTQAVWANTEVLNHVRAGSSETLYPGSFVLGTDALGVLAYSDSSPVSITIGGTPTNCYLLQPVDQTRIKAGTTSYISVDGKYLSVQWLTTDVAGMGLKANYTYQVVTKVRPRYVRGYYNRLLMASTAEVDGSTNVYYPWRVRWTELGSRSLAKFTSYQDLIDTDVSNITGWEEQGFYLTIVKRQCLYKVSHVGGDLIFLFQVAWKHGCPNGRTLKNFNSMQYFLGEDDVYRWDGSTLTSLTLDTETGNYRVKNAIMSMVTFSTVSSVFASLDLVNKEYWLWIPEATQTTVFVYSMAYNTWTKFTYATKITAASLGRVNDTDPGTYQSAIGSYATYGGNFAESSETLGKVQFFGGGGSTTSGKVYVSDEKVNIDFAVLADNVYAGTTIPSYLITKDFIYSDVYTMDRTQRVELDLYGENVTIGWDGDFSLEPSIFKNTQTQTLTPAWLRRYYYPDCVCYQVRLCISSTLPISMRLINLYALSSRIANR